MTHGMRRDARHGVRRWRQRPLFSVAAIATIALSIGAATAIFSMVDGVLLKPLPFPAAGRLGLISSCSPRSRISAIAPCS